jgi:membrane protein implicated in regulation of membrane protease activity
MPWWGWIAVGTLLLAAEMTVVDLEFYLVFLAASAFVVGLLGLGGLPMPYWMQWIVFALLAVGSLVLFRQRIYKRLRPPPDAVVREGVEGALATATVPIAPGETGEVSLRGTNWTGRNVGSAPIPAGSVCRVDRSEGLVLELRLDSEGGD